MIKGQVQMLKTRGYTQTQVIARAPLFRGNRETISSLKDFIDKVYKKKSNRYTSKQRKALIKAAKVLISYVEA